MARLFQLHAILLFLGTFLLSSSALDFRYCSTLIKNLNPVCPSPSTFDALKINSYLGKWYEIGSSAQFKVKPFNENGLICITANYSIAKKKKSGLEITVLNRGLLVTKLGFQIRVQLASSSAYNLIERLGILCELSASIYNSVEFQKKTYSKTIASLSSKIRPTAANFYNAYRLIPLRLSRLSANIDRYVQASQVRVGRLSQGGGVSTNRLISSALTQMKRIDTASRLMIKTIKSVDRIAFRYRYLLLAYKPKGYAARVARIDLWRYELSNIGPFITSMKALRGFNQIMERQIRGIPPKVKPTEVPTNVTLLASQSLTSKKGRLGVGFPGAPPSAYWIIDLEGNANSNYEVSLVWTCSNFSSPTTLRSVGAIAGQQNVFLLSRTPSLPEKVIKRVFDNAKKKGVVFTGDNPFVRTVQNEKRCESYLDSIY